MGAFRGDKERAAAMLISRTEITPECIEIGYMYKEIWLKVLGERKHVAVQVDYWSTENPIRIPGNIYRRTD